MKPIEIHIEGYKIVISKDEDKTDDCITVKEEKISVPNYYPTYPVHPTTGEWWRYPFATWTADDAFNTTMTCPENCHTQVTEKDDNISS